VPVDWTDQDTSYERFDRENQRRLAAQRQQRHAVRWWRWYAVLGTVYLVLVIVLFASGATGPLAAFVLAISGGTIGASLGTAFRGWRLARPARDGEQ
jgi:uncharacterized iron-regulated membrane protein